MDIVVQKNRAAPVRDDVSRATDVYRSLRDAPFPARVARLRSTNNLLSDLALLMADHCAWQNAARMVVTLAGSLAGQRMPHFGSIRTVREGESP